MTDEEKAKEWVRTNSGYSTKEFHGQKAIEAFLAGLEAGKDMAETDLATIAYMQGAERYKTKWHKVADRDLPKNNTAVLVILKNKRMKISTFMENKFTIWNNDYDAYTKLYDVIAWCEIPMFEG